jgi:WD40 repeat protein
MAEDARSQEGQGGGATTRRSLLAGMGALLAWPERVRPASAQGQGSTEGGGRPLKVKGVRQISIDAPKSATAMAWAPDSRRIAVGRDLEKEISVWDAQTGRRLPGPGEYGPVSCMAYSPDGRYLVTDRGVSIHPGQPGAPPTAGGVTGSYSTILWDAMTGAWVQNLVDERDEIPARGAHALAFSADSRYLGLAYTFQTAFYTEERGVWRRVGGLYPGLLQQIAFSPDGTKIAGVERRHHPGQPTGDATLKLIEVPSARILADWVTFTPVGAERRRVAYSPNGREIAVGQGTQLAIVDAGSGKLLRTMELDRPYEVLSLSYSLDARYLGVAVRDLYVYDTTSWVLVAKLSEHGFSRHRLIMQTAFSPDGSMIAAVGGNPITVWDLAR